MLDRIDIHVEVVPVPIRELSNEPKSEKSELICERVIKARKIQEDRIKESNGIYCNAQMISKQLRQICRIDETVSTLLKNAMEKLSLSARAYDHILKVVRSISDLYESPGIKLEHLAEAFHYRSSDRENWDGKKIQCESCLFTGICWKTRTGFDDESCFK